MLNARSESSKDSVLVKLVSFSIEQSGPPKIVSSELRVEGLAVFVATQELIWNKCEREEARPNQRIRRLNKRAGLVEECNECSQKGC